MATSTPPPVQSLPTLPAQPYRLDVPLHDLLKKPLASPTPARAEKEFRISLPLPSPVFPQHPELLHFAATMGSRESDAPLVDAARRCEPEAFKELMTKYGARVFRIAMRITRNHEDAEEDSQDAFAWAFLHMDRFRGDSRFYTWLVRIAINQSLMKLRTRRGRALEFDGRSTIEDGPLWADVADDALTPEQHYAQEELHGLLASAIADLPMSSREVLHLRDVEEHSTEETARMLGLSVAAVKSRTRRGRNRLRQELRKHFAGASSPVSPARVGSHGRLSLRGR